MSAFRNFVIVLITNCCIHHSYAQQKEITVDFSSSQRPDTSLLKTNLSPEKKGFDSASKASNIEQLTYSYQTIDSIKREILALRKDLEAEKNLTSEIQLNLDLCHRKFKKGNIFFLSGLGAYTLGSLLIAGTANTQDIPSEAIFLTLGGLGSMIAGAIMKTSSHKYIGKAGNAYARRNRTTTYQFR
ncbi:MAG: hypothetical protein EAZ07_09810 [Cytophagales bacterium]|nr:MAG: hypothetical protein EAZ07_09810 [Cytophagales bacterium]